MAEPQPLLEIDFLETGYGNHRVVSGVNLAVKRGEVLALIGHNGAGKLTLLKAVFGLLPVWSGSVRVAGEDVTTSSPGAMLRRGVSLVPQGNRVFRSLTVRESLELAISAGSRATNSPHTIDEVLENFPALSSRASQLAGTLSGGEKQMLALCSSLVLKPRLLLLDEPSLGLAPRLVAYILNRVRHIASEGGVGVLLVEQKVREALRRSDSVVALRRGRVSFSGEAGGLLEDKDKLRDVYL